MLIQHIQVRNIDMCFIIETWIQHGNEPKHQYIKLDTKYSLRAEKVEKVDK